MARPWRLTLLWAALVLLGTQHPFVLDPWSVTVPSETFWIPRLKGMDPPFNVLMFMPLGWAFRARGHRLTAAILAGFGFSALIELGQHYVPFRVPVAEDLFFNTIGSAVGWWLGPRLGEIAARLDRPRWRAGLAVALAAFVLWSASPPLVTAELWGWSPRAELIAGRERPGNYRWPGQVRRARLWVGTSTRAAPDWDLHRDGEGIFEALAARIDGEQQFVLQTVLRGPPTPTPQDDLLRILVWTGGVQRRSFLLGQAVDVMVFRLGTRVTPVVGQFPDRTEPLAMPAIPEGQTATVTITYDRGRLTGRVGGHTQQGELRRLPQHNGVRRFWLPRGRRGALIYAFSAALVLAAALSGAVVARAAFAGGLGLAFATMLIQQIAFGWGPSGWAVLGAVLGAGLGAWTARR